MTTDQKYEERELDRVARLADKHEIELHGPRGIYAALSELTEQMRWTNRALWGVAAAVMAGSVMMVIQSAT